MTNKYTMQALFEEQALRFPNHIAALKNSQKLTYGELNHKANQLAHYLQKIGVKPETPVGLCVESSFDFLISLIAILKSGGAYLPIDSAQPEGRIVHVLQDSQAPILITKSTYKNKLAFYKGTFILLDDKKSHLLKEPTDNPPQKSIPEHLAYIIYTSGSTGTPKGVLIEHRSLINYCQWFADYSYCKPNQRVDFSGNPIFDMAITTTLVPLMLGLTVVICDETMKKEVPNYLCYLAESHINIIKLTPSYFKVLLQEAKNNFIALPELKCIILGGENLSASECQSWLTLYPDQVLFNEYGPTEATVAVSTYKVNAQNCTHLNNNVPIGKPGTNMSCFILDTNYEPVPDGEIGELFIGGIGLARGYLNQHELTQERFIIKNKTRLYKTGDLCKKGSDDTLEYLGRIDEQVKIRGYRIEPKEVEKSLLNHPDIKEVVVVAQKDSFDEQKLIAYYILKNKNNALQTKLIRDYLQKYLPDYIIPTSFVAVDFFPLTANGKLDKAALPIPLIVKSHNYIAPKHMLEKKLARIWSEELGIQLIGIQDNFFDLGGHSLSAARIVARIKNELNKTISLQSFYTAPNIEKLAPIIQHTKKYKQRHLQNNSKYQKIPVIPLSDFQFLLWMSHVFEPKAQKLNIVGKKRFQGRLNQEALEYAFQAVLKKHEALTYHLLKLKPAQRTHKDNSFQLITHNLCMLSEPQREKKLEESIIKLINFYPWSRKKPLLIGKLFYLKEDESELQICLSHLISDDHCMDIIFSELSNFYKNYKQSTLDSIEADTYFKQHIFSERYSMKMSLSKDILFWEEHLKDSSLFEFPKEYVVTNMKEKKFPYSTYTLLPKNTLDALQTFCDQNHIGISNTLCAVIAIALRNCCGKHKKTTHYTYMNIIKSTRDNPIYDNTIGCFLRVEPVKIFLEDAATLTSLSHQIRRFTIETSNYQQCSNLIKLSSIPCFKPNKFEIFFTNLLIPIYNKLFKIPLIYRNILKRYGSRIMAFKRSKKFLININIRSNFITPSNNKLNLFGLNTKQAPINKNDLLAIDYIFEANFFHDDNQNHHYLVISANLKPDFREIIAQEVIHIMNSINREIDANELNLYKEII